MTPSLKISIWLILVCVWLTTLIGIRAIPLEKHEAFVLQTAQAMESSGDLILPYFNGVPRLQKPPFSYWTTLLVSTLDPVNSDVQVWHGRLVSLLGGLLMAALTLVLGTHLYGRKTGLLAAVFMLSAQGFIHMSHNARPDLLYAAFGTLQLFAWVASWRSEDGTRRQLGFSLLGWGGAALATLTKGPQIPMVFLVGLLIFLLFSPERKRILPILRPVRGISLFALLVLPWWILFNRRLQAEGIDIQESQMSGSLLRNMAGWKEILSGYYIWNLFSQLLPASLLTPFLLRGIWKKKTLGGDATRLLLSACITLLVIFTLGGHYRKHYLLPLLPVASLFLALAVTRLQGPVLHKRVRMILYSLGAMAVLGFAVLLLVTGGYVAFILLSVVGAALCLLLKSEFNTAEWKPDLFMAHILSLSILTAVSVAGYNALLTMNPIRVAEESLARKIKQEIQPHDRLVEWKSSTEILSFFTKHNVPFFSEADELVSFLDSQGSAGTIYAVLPVEELPVFKTMFSIRILYKTGPSKRPSKDLAWVEILDLPPAGNRVKLDTSPGGAD